MRRLLAVAVVLASARAGAEEQYVEPPAAKPLRVESRLDGDTARFSVRYLVRAEKVANDATGKFGLPRRGLITAASVTEGGQRHELQLMAAEKASAEFNALWEIAPGRSRRWAVLIEAEQYTSDFMIMSAVPRQTTLIVDVQIAVATCFQRDARYVFVPDQWLSRMPASMRTSAREADGIHTACGGDRSHEWSGMSWVKFSSRGLTSRRGGADRIGTYAGRALLGKTNVVKLEMNLAARVSEVPADLVTAIVVDASRSTTPEELEAQRETIAAYLRAAPNGRVQVIEYARHARALLPSWTTARQATPRIERELRAMQRRNGSNIAEGLREAGRWLDQTTGTRRILLFTDEQLTIRDEHTHVIDDAIPANTLVHVVALGGEGLARDDAAKLARVAKKTKGISVRGGEVLNVDQPPGRLDATMLARPISLDHVRVRTPGWKALATEHACPETEEDLTTSFAEGSQCTWWGQGDAVSSPFVVEGFLWGEHVQRVLRADLGRSLEVVRELSAMQLLEEDLQKLAERSARAVNSVWSLYASWGGDDGYSDGYGFGRSGFGIGCGGCGHDNTGFGGGTGSLGPRPDLAVELARIVRTCKPAQPVDVEVETTLEEIVDVEVKAVSADLRTCVQDALWNAWLVAPGAPVRTITRFSVKPA